MTALHMEIQQLRANVKTFTAPVTFLHIAPLVPVVDLFAHEEPLQISHEKRRHTNNNPDTVRLQTGLTKEQELEFVVMHSRKDEEMQ